MIGLQARAPLAAAAEWRLLSLLLSRPRSGWHDEIAALAGEVGTGALREAAEAARGASEGPYHALLGAGGPASPREVAHAGFADPGRLLADLAARYAAFGFTPRSEEPHDHVSVECDFVGYLFLKEAYALACGDAEAAEVTRAARGSFLGEHAAVAGRRLAGRLPGDAPGYLRAAAELLATRVPEPPPSPARGIAPDEDPLCGGCPALGAPADR